MKLVSLAEVKRKRYEQRLRAVNEHMTQGHLKTVFTVEIQGPSLVQGPSLILTFKGPWS